MIPDQPPVGERQPRDETAVPFPREKPVKVGDELDVTITEVSRRGEGVARVEGFVIFVPTGRQGQQARIRVTTVMPNFATAEILGETEA